mmetsp:Transcript_85790/g.255771  ORF Transcript_85790/g.255771 Transcript_85790/m.255771 type:complete len:391 (+) Transcript_85790:126-1298(+)
MHMAEDHIRVRLIFLVLLRQLPPVAAPELVPRLQSPVHELEQRPVHLLLHLTHLRHGLPHVVLHLHLEIPAMLDVADPPVDNLLLLDLGVLLGVPLQDPGLDVLQLPVVLLPQVFLLHLLEQVRLVLLLEVLQAVLLEALCLEEMPVHLLLLRIGALRIIVASAPLHRRDILLQLLHQRRLPFQAVLQLLGPLLFLFVHDAVVLPHGLGLLLHLQALLLLAAALVLHVLLEDLAHVPLGLLPLPLEAALLGLHLVHDLLHERGLLVLLPIELLGLQLPLEVQLIVPVLLLPHELIMPLLFPRLLGSLPPLELNHRVLVVPHVLHLVLLPPLPLVRNLAVEIHSELPLQGLHSHLLPQGVLLVQVRSVLIQLRPVKRLGCVGALHDVHARQ